MLFVTCYYTSYRKLRRTIHCTKTKECSNGWISVSINLAFPSSCPRQESIPFHDYKRGSFQRGLMFKLVLLMWHTIVSGIEDCSWKIPCWRGIRKCSANSYKIKCKDVAWKIRNYFFFFLKIDTDEDETNDRQMRILLGNLIPAFFYFVFMFYVKEERYHLRICLIVYGKECSNSWDIVFFINLTVRERKIYFKKLDWKF